jgi:hypothetical protein
MQREAVSYRRPRYGGRRRVLGRCPTVLHPLLLTAALSECAAPGGQSQNLVHLEPLASADLSNLGPVVDVAVDQAGHLFILDTHLPGVVVLDSTLIPLTTFGGRGSDLGQFRDPVSVEVLSKGRIAVLDRALRRVTIIAAQEGARALEARDALHIDGPSEDFCSWSDTSLIVYGLSGGYRVHIYGLDGSRFHSLAPPAADLSAMAASLLTKGRIACNPNSDEVILSSSFQPTIEVFNVSSGVRVALDTLSPYRALTIHDRGYEVSISSGPAGHSAVSNVFDIGPYRIVQTTYNARRDGANVDTVVTYVYSKSSDAWLPAHTALPLIFGLSEGIVFSIRPDHRGQARAGLERITIREVIGSRPRVVDNGLNRDKRGAGL